MRRAPKLGCSEGQAPVWCKLNGVVHGSHGGTSFRVVISAVSVVLMYIHCIMVAISLSIGRIFRPLHAAAMGARAGNI